MAERGSRTSVDAYIHYGMVRSRSAASASSAMLERAASSGRCRRHARRTNAASTRQPSRKSVLKDVATIGLDFAKTSVHFAGLDASGRVLTRRQHSEGKLLEVTAKTSLCRIGMEACWPNGRSCRSRSLPSTASWWRPETAPAPKHGKGVRFRLPSPIDGIKGRTRVSQTCQPQWPSEVVCVMGTEARGVHRGPEPAPLHSEVGCIGTDHRSSRRLR